MKFDCVIFDLDGTLTDSQPLWIRARCDLMESRGITPTEADKTLMGRLEIPDFAIAASRDYPTGLTPEEVTGITLATMARYYAEAVPLKPGARELLLELRRRGIVCCLASASLEERFMPMLRRLQLVELLDHIVTTHQVGKNKEHPDIYLEAARRAGTLPQRTLVVEDTLYCARVAKNAGFLTMAVHEPYSEGTPQEMTDLCSWFAWDLAHLPADFWQD